MRKAARIMLLGLAITAFGVSISGGSVLADQIGPGTGAPVATHSAPGGN